MMFVNIPLARDRRKEGFRFWAKKYRNRNRICQLWQGEIKSTLLFIPLPTRHQKSSAGTEQEFVFRNLGNFFFIFRKLGTPCSDHSI